MISRLARIKQGLPIKIVPQPKTKVHTVTFIMSDMDNILTEIGTDSFFSTRKFYANPHRGEFPMTWGMAPSLK